MGRLGSNPTIRGKFIQLCFIPLFRRSCHEMGVRPGSDFTSLHRKWLCVIINDDFLGEGGEWGRGVTAYHLYLR